MENVMLEREHGGHYANSCLLACVLYCIKGVLEEIITAKIRLNN